MFKLGRWGWGKGGGLKNFPKLTKYFWKISLSKQQVMIFKGNNANIDGLPLFLSFTTFFLTGFIVYYCLGFPSCIKCWINFSPPAHLADNFTGQQTGEPSVDSDLCSQRNSLTLSLQTSMFIFFIFFYFYILLIVKKTKKNIFFWENFFKENV